MFNLKQRIVLSLSAFLLSVASMPTLAQTDWPEVPPTEAPAHWGAVSANFEEIPYPYPVHFLELNRFQQDIRMAYMDVPPTGRANGQTVFIQHGMNFYSEAYTPTIKALSAAGFRVLAVDRIGYGKSTKPILPYSFNFVAANMKSLLDELEIDEVAIFGHSMGGMTVSRFAMVYPDITTHVVMVNQIGLTDQRQSRPWRDPFAGGGTTTYQSILRGHQNYFPLRWPPEHLEFVRRQFGQTMSGEWNRVAQVRRLQGQMLYDDPVVYDWQHIETKALVIGGEEDGLVDDFPTLAHNVNNELQNSTILLYPDVGHAPQIEIPDLFHADVIRFLKSDPNAPASAWK
ncbi:MAG: pimeloyl-ACP methyl ester carboxylesterase [Kiritimatiellia bacterium]|jgi:pimeloyl-ACP methyl ester carboxylesterase